MRLRFDVVWQEWPQFAIGLGNTVWLCGVSMLLSLVLAALFLAPLTARNRYLRRGSQAIVDAGRCVPFLLLTYIVYFALPAVGIVLSKWTAALATLVLYNTAYMAEILRAGWVSLPQEQFQAGRRPRGTSRHLCHERQPPVLCRLRSAVLGEPRAFLRDAGYPQACLDPAKFLLCGRIP